MNPSGFDYSGIIAVPHADAQGSGWGWLVFFLVIAVVVSVGGCLCAYELGQKDGMQATPCIEYATPQELGPVSPSPARDWSLS